MLSGAVERLRRTLELTNSHIVFRDRLDTVPLQAYCICTTVEFLQYCDDLRFAGHVLKRMAKAEWIAMPVRPWIRQNAVSDIFEDQEKRQSQFESQRIQYYGLEATRTLYYWGI
jgi:hypothetical protein